MPRNSIAPGSPVLTRGGMCVLSTVASFHWQYRHFGSALMAVGLSQLPTPRAAWESIPDFIRDPSISTDCFRRLEPTSVATIGDEFDDNTFEAKAKGARDQGSRERRRRIRINLRVMVQGYGWGVAAVWLL